MSFLRNLFKGRSQKRLLDESDAVRQEYQRQDAETLAYTKACSAVSLAFIIESEEQRNSSDFLDALVYMHGEKGSVIPSHKTLEQLHDVLISWQRQANAKRSLGNKIIANGMPLWILSVRSLANPIHIPYAKIVWDAVERADKTSYLGYISEMEELYKGSPLDSRISNFGIQFFERPTMFRPLEG